MRIAIDVSPLSTGHKVRGVGSYINLLVSNLEKYDRNNKYVFVEDKKFPKDADIIHYPYFDPFFITLPLHSSKKFIVTVHDLTPLVFPEHFPAGFKGNLKWLVQKRNLKKADIIIADSIVSKNDIVKIVGIPENRVRVVYLAADPAFQKLSTKYWILDTKRKFSLPENFLLYVGDATWNKNLPRLVEAVRQTKYTLVMVGKVWVLPQTPSQRTLSGGKGSAQEGEVNSNPWNTDLRDVIRTIEGDPQFIRLGFVPTEDLVKIYNLATVFVMPSIYEGFGLPVLEAMNCGCPVITTRQGSLPEVAGDAAAYVDPFDTKSITEGISKIINNEKLGEELSKKALEQAKKFSIQQFATNLVKAYEESARA